MERGRMQFSVMGLLISVACVAVNVWLFRVGPIWGILGINVTKHVVIASLCQRLGVDQAGREAHAGRSLRRRRVAIEPKPLAVLREGA
jgi:hypothetical protein